MSKILQSALQIIKILFQKYQYFKYTISDFPIITRSMAKIYHRSIQLIHFLSWSFNIFDNHKLRHMLLFRAPVEISLVSDRTVINFLTICSFYLELLYCSELFSLAKKRINKQSLGLFPVYLQFNFSDCFWSPLLEATCQSFFSLLCVTF